MSPALDVVFDPAAAYPDIAVLSTALARRDWPACRTLLDAVSTADRTALILTCAEGRDLEGFLRPVVEADPYDGAAAALLGAHLITLGWEIRTSAWAKDVTPAQWAGFRAYLCRAEQVLIDAAAYQPADPAIWTVRMLSARGLSLGIDEIRRRHQRLDAVAPHHLPGQMELASSLEPKWSGSWPELHAFAREAALAAPAGSPHGLLVVEAFFAHFRTATDEAEKARVYHDPALRDALYAAAHHSVLHPQFRRAYGWVRACGNYAALFSILEDRPNAARMFTMLGPLGTVDPWSESEQESAVKIRQAREWAYGGTL
ncbi:hypothetical protein ACTOB_000699 [Actinoplanes oblitus]|uniref:DUF4034 domain-containing protein n=1 Tax=Actinoplanes oblitus TaxID=3040509 RepID=A0ABY8WK06_9ACTN|nr:hypothetical protein [Actinoplanes oblitus]WIM97197.1 hypothetical protein ACTOB_000699 [Actinoplanes oblitus]